jgi:hypothetical protein
MQRVIAGDYIVVKNIGLLNHDFVYFIAIKPRRIRNAFYTKYHEQQYIFFYFRHNTVLPPKPFVPLSDKKRRQCLADITWKPIITVYHIFLSLSSPLQHKKLHKRSQNFF